MATKERNTPSLPFNPAVLRWARMRRNYSIEEVAKRIGTGVRNVEAWESPGGKTPSLRQARELADFYGRPFLEFFYDEPPALPEPALVPDFRMHREAGDPRGNVELMELQSWAEEQRLNALDLFEVLGERPPEFPAELMATLAEAPDQVAKLAREVVNFPVAAQIRLKASERDSLPKILRRKFERIGILVLRESGLAKHRARGLCLALFPLPVIVYGKEAPGAQAFTLAHELGHVLLRQSAISGPPSLDAASTAPGGKTEDWCDRFAASFLVPADALAALVAKPLSPMEDIDDLALKGLAKAFAISPHAMLIRLVRLDYVRAEYYWDTKRQQFLEEEEEYEGGGRSEYYGSRFRSSRGDLYTGMVLEALATGRITNHTAGELMGIKNLRHLEDIRDHFAA